MPELAWLSCLRGEWLLVTLNEQDGCRRWLDRDIALQDLAEEGWTILNSRGLRLRRSSRLRAPGYCLRRVVH